MLFVLLGMLVRLCLALHSYSGQNKAPMFGDYEAQRHWMEITYNLPIDKWYFNSTDNDLMYWGLDYPPLTAYHSYLCGYVAASINTSYIELFDSRGLESASHKNFMRLSVFLADLLTFIPAIVLFYKKNQNRSTIAAVSVNEVTKLCCLLALIYPGIIIVDHGHFQYNCISLGLLVFAVIFIGEGRHLLSSICFCCALTYKQMELYHALPFFFYLLGTCYPIWKKQGILASLYELSRLGIVVVATLAIICFPFISDINKASQLMKRLFPVARGVFEDKVANIWCLINVVYKLKMLVSNETMAIVCLICTSLAVTPSSYDIFRNVSFAKFKYSLINSALAFYLFSYQVHEKTILLAAVPALFVLPHDPLASIWFLTISVFSMLPLFLKDNLLIPFIALSILFILTFISSSIHYQNKAQNVLFIKSKNLPFSLSTIDFNNIFYVSLMGCSILTVIVIVIDPPQKLPDLFPLIIYIYSCIHFIGFFIYFNIVQLGVHVIEISDKIK